VQQNICSYAHLFPKNTDVHCVHRYFYLREGRGMDTAKDMWKVYEKTSTVDLLKNRARKVNQLRTMEKFTGYWSKKEKARLAHMIDQIDAVIAARAAQPPLF